MDDGPRSAHRTDNVHRGQVLLRGLVADARYPCDLVPIVLVHIRAQQGAQERQGCWYAWKQVFEAAATGSLGGGRWEGHRALEGWKRSQVGGEAAQGLGVLQHTRTCTISDYGDHDVDIPAETRRDAAGMGNLDEENLKVSERTRIQLKFTQATVDINANLTFKPKLKLDLVNMASREMEILGKPVARCLILRIMTRRNICR